MKKGEGIRIFLRVRPAATAKQSHILGALAPDQRTCKYSVEHTFDTSKIAFHLDRTMSGEVINNSLDEYTFSFRRVFEPSATQEEVFNSVAKDCVESALDGYNSTIFAYGQTGSGKTFSITGGTESYQDRGIIPRSIAMIYDETAKRTDFNWTVSISYLQIYNDKGQDLLNHGKDARALEDLPTVTVQEGEDEVVLRGLEQHCAPTLADALNLLFLGDTNRLYCETPMNKTSSRSHCVFIVSLEARSVGSSVVRRSKLNLVDLAGSERVSKTGVVGNTLTEAKYINLSLHYLEHVIISLSEQAKGHREHIPFRNSFMTMVLRDSLGGNCRTSMLATAHPAVNVIQETLSTCKFAQRVALIRQNAHVNEETDPVLLVRKLKAEVAQLKDHLAFYETSGQGGGADRVLTEDEKMMCRSLVETYMANTDEQARLTGFEGDLARIYYCFSVLRDAARRTGGSVANQPVASGASLEEVELFRSQVDQLQLSLQQKENELNMLLEVLHKLQGAKFNAETQTTAGGDGQCGPPTDASAMTSARQLVEELRQNRLYSKRNSTHMDSCDAAGMPVRHPTTVNVDAALAHVNKLCHNGKLSEAQATAAEEFFKKKQEHLHSAYDLSALTDAELLTDRTAAFEAFKRSYRNYAKVEASKDELRGKYDKCKTTARDLNAVVDEIKRIKVQVQRLRAERATEGVETVDSVERGLLDALGRQKETYNTLSTSLRQQKEEIDAMHAYMKRAQEQLTSDFDDWFGVRRKQVAQAVHGSPEGGAPLPQRNEASHVPVDTPADINAATKPHGELPPLVSVSNGSGGGGCGGAATSSLGISGGSQGLSRAHVVTAPSVSMGGTPAGGSSVRAPADFASSRLSSTAPSSAFEASKSLTRESLNNMSTRGAVPPQALSNAPQVNSWVIGSPPTDRGAPSSSISPGATPTVLSRPFAISTQATAVAGTNTLNANRHPANQHHLQPLSVSPRASSPTAPTVSSASVMPNLYAPEHRSTGNAAADEKLAALYRARDAMRLQLQQTP